MLKIFNRCLITEAKFRIFRFAAMGFALLSAHIPHYFLADHPFIILLQHKTNILFHGKVSHPVSGDANIAPRGEPVKDPFSHIINITL